ncbi:MAG TPA: PPOX class F420-dependent oxidoreductase, partial [Gammaproteobacteria bacterium]|nr:PPOX class F420-dependent oxidoreductase [Gammaproteobacteria bacterium]
MISNQENYINLSTRKRDGSFVNTPVWFAQEGETNNYYVYSLNNVGKVKRIRNFPEVKVGICTYSGKPKGGWFYAIADLVDEPENTKVAYSVLRKKYGIKFRIGDFFSWIKGTYHKRQIIKF